MSDRFVLCPRDALAPGEARRFDVEGHRVALVRIGDDFRRVFAQPRAAAAGLFGQMVLLPILGSS